MQFTSAPSISVDQRLDSSNKGHQLLQKMGYTGLGGLGRKEQGIVNPIKGGEIRDKVDQYRGVGLKSDPFEAFRKQRSIGYIQRLRTRDELRNEESIIPLIFLTKWNSPSLNCWEIKVLVKVVLELNRTIYLRFFDRSWKLTIFARICY